MNIKKIGNDKTYIEYNSVVNFGTRIGIKKIGESTFVIDEKEKTIKYGRQSFEFRHRAGVTPYTSTFVFAQCCVFNKQLQPAGIFD